MQSNPNEADEKNEGSGGQLGQVGTGLSKIADALKKIAEIFSAKWNNGIWIAVLIGLLIYQGWDKQTTKSESVLTVSEQKRAIDSATAKIQRLMDERHQEDIDDKMDLMEKVIQLTETNKRLNNALDLCQSQKR